MGAAHRAAAHMDRRCHDTVYIQFLHQQTYGGNIHDGIHAAHFMEVDLLYRYTMHLTFRRCNFCEYCHNIQLDHGGNGKAIHNTADFRHTAMMMAMMVVEVFILLHIMNFHAHMGTHNTAFHAFFCRYHHTGETQIVNSINKRRGVRMKFQQGSRQHIPGSTHATINIERSHFLPSIWLIILAR